MAAEGTFAYHSGTLGFPANTTTRSSRLRAIRTVTQTFVSWHATTTKTKVRSIQSSCRSGASTSPRPSVSTRCFRRRRLCRYQRFRHASRPFRRTSPVSPPRYSQFLYNALISRKRQRSFDSPLAYFHFAQHDAQCRGACAKHLRRLTQPPLQVSPATATRAPACRL